MNNKQKIVCGLMLLLCQPVWAQHTVSLHNNSSATLAVSASCLNRIYVERDRIQNVRGLEGDYVLKQDDEAGEIYIKPIRFDDHTVVPIFLTTEGGSHYQLNLRPISVPAQTWAIHPLDVQPLRAKAWEQASPYEQTLVELIEAMMLNNVPDGYVQSKLFTKHQASRQWVAGMEIIPLRRYQGDELTGELYGIHNTSDHPLVLNPTMLMQPNVRALATIDYWLPPKTSTVLYVVMSHD